MTKTSRDYERHQATGEGYAYCGLDHPGGDAEAKEWCRWYHSPSLPVEAVNVIQTTAPTLLGLVTDDTPASLEYGDYRGYVLIDAQTGEWLGDVPGENARRMRLGAAIYSEEYEDLRPVLSA